VRDALRAGDKVARIGDERFGLIVDAPFADEAISALGRIGDAVARLVAENPRWEGLFLTVGLAPLWAEDPGAAVEQAARTLERARERGPGSVMMTTATRPVS
jgi:GGDEF domain-containing protein